MSSAAFTSRLHRSDCECFSKRYQVFKPRKPKMPSELVTPSHKAEPLPPSAAQKRAGAVRHQQGSKDRV